VALRDGNYTDVPLEVVTASKKVVNIDQFYDTERYRPKYENFANKPQFVLTSEG
jgi:6-phosphofructokinase 1